jgi:hypothetical protein
VREGSTLVWVYEAYLIQINDGMSLVGLSQLLGYCGR